MDTGEISFDPDEWAETEARYARAKQVLLRVQQQHCEAASEFLRVRAQLLRILKRATPAQRSSLDESIPT